MTDLPKIGYKLLDGEALVVATVQRGEYETPVWIQSRWEEGEYACYVRKNGCGHCCVAMAARLFGVPDVTPHSEYEHCLALFGEPSAEKNDGHFLSALGIARSLRGFGVKAEAYGYLPNEEEAVTERMLQALREGKLVIHESFPVKPNNPFSTGAHYVLFFGLDDCGRVLVANSSLRANPPVPGIGSVPPSAITDSLLASGGVIGPDDSWGRGGGRLTENAGYVIVG